MSTQERGVCRLTLVPVRSAGSHKAELVTQLLFGDHYTVLEPSGDGQWLQISIYHDGYVGWIDAKQHYRITEDYFSQINNSDYKIVTDIYSSILFKKRYINILIGSVIPISTNELFQMEEQLAFHGQAKSLSQKRQADFVREIAFKYLNTPYLWGGKTPFGADCSGFVQQVFRICGYSLKRDSYQQAKQGIAVDTLAEAMPGDLAFFTEPGKHKISHVGIVLEENKIVHAHGHVRMDELNEDGIFQQDTGKGTHLLEGLRRIIKSRADDKESLDS